MTRRGLLLILLAALLLLAILIAPWVAVLLDEAFGDYCDWVYRLMRG